MTLLIFATLTAVILHEFAAATLSDQRIAVNQDLLNSAAASFPASGRILARLAELEQMPLKSDFESAEQHLQQAIILSPNNYRYRLMLAQIRNLRGDRVGTELAYSEAIRLAPNYSEVHWRFANFLVKENRIEESVAHFRIASVANPNIFGAALELVAAVSDDNIFFLNEVVKENPRGQLKLALLLANQSRLSEASEIFSNLDRNISLSAWETSAFLDALIDKGFSKLAFNHWNQLKNGEEKNLDSSPVWNGDFETESDPKLAQFDWHIGKSVYARIGYDNSQAHSGNCSLLIDFLGRDTVRLDNEVNHLAALRPETNYRLEFYVKTEKYKTSEGPHIAISDREGNRIARSESVPAGTNDWTRMSVNFTTPLKKAGDSVALVISVKRLPQYNYDEPSSGRIWFDDFVLNEVRSK